MEDYVYSNVSTRYRLTLAHEVGHIVRILPKPMVEPDAYQDFLGECLGQAFEVSPEAAARRLKKWNELNRR